MKILLIILSIAINYNIHSSELIDLIGYDKYYKTKKDETLIDIARANNLAFPEIMSANQGLDDPWVVEPEKNLLLPQRHLLPSAKREGVIVNKGDLRLYYFSKENKVYSFPIGIGRGDWETPTGKARITGKKKTLIGQYLHQY